MTKEQQMRAIGKTLREAMAQRKDCDWTRETPLTIATQASLDESVTRFVLEDGTREQCRQAYKAYAEAHLR